MVIDPTYFSKGMNKPFEMERVCIDKVFFIVYDAKYAQENHTFDTELRDTFIQHIKRSRIKKGRPEEVIRKESNYSSWELQLRGARTMRFHVNLIHYLQEQHNLKPSNVIYDDNFLPVESNIAPIDFIAALRRFVSDAQELYKSLVKKHWGEDLKDVRVKFSEIEIPFEVYPASVEDIAQNLYSKGISFSKYNTQSGTIYLNSPKCDNEMHVSRKYDQVQKLDTADISPDITYINKINSGRNDSKIQIKIYQKTFGLCRIEFTMFSGDARTLFDMKRPDEDMADDMVLFCHYCLRENGIVVDRYDRSMDDVVQFLAVTCREPEDLIYRLKDCDVFEACQANRSVRQRLVKKGLLLKKYDSDGKMQRGVYLVNPIIKDFLRLYKEEGHEHFVKGGLFPDL